MINLLPSILDTNSQLPAGLGSTAKHVMGKDDFLKLLVAQMQAQDPLSPMESADFSAQLAQFSALEQMQNVNVNLEDLKQYQVSINNNMTINLIDKNVTAPGNGLLIFDGKADSIFYELGANATSVSVNIHDSDNNLVASIPRGQENAGDHKFTWDGKDFNGKTLPEGSYTFSINAKDNAGSPVAALTYQKSKVTGIGFEDGISYILSGENRINVSDIISVNSIQ